MSLTAGSQAISWGIWAFSAKDRDLVSLDFDLTLDAGNSAWIAVANDVSEAWELIDEIYADGNIPLDDAQHKSPEGTVYCAVITWDGKAALCDKITLNWDSGSNVPPTAMLAADPLSGTAPLLVRFDSAGSADSDGTLSSYQWDFDGDGFFSEAGSEAAAADDPAPSCIYDTDGTFTAMLRITDNGGVDDTASVVIDIGSTGNSAPLADIQADVTHGPVPLVVSFSTTSFDLDGTIERYSWDFNGDGLYSNTPEEITAEGLTTPAAYTYSISGNYRASLQVEDDDGTLDTAQLAISATDVGWAVVTLGNGQTFTNPSLITLANGNPAVCCTKTNGELLYYVSSTETGASPGDWQEVSVGAGPCDFYSSLALIGGKPAIAFEFQDLANISIDLRYACSSTADGASPGDWTNVVVDGEGDTGHCPSLAEINGKPAIAYGRVAEGMVYARSSTATGSSAGDWSNFSIGGSGAWEISDHCSMRVIDGKPAIAYYADYGAISKLQYLFSSDASGGTSASDWSSILIDDSSSDVGRGCTLASVDGKPAIAYADMLSSTLIFAFSATAGGSSVGDWSRIAVEGKNPYFGGNAQVSLATIYGLPAIAYPDVLRTQMLIESNTPGGTASGDWSSSLADAGAQISQGCSLADVMSYPAMAYTHMYEGTMELRYAIRLPSS